MTTNRHLAFGFAAVALIISLAACGAGSAVADVALSYRNQPLLESSETPGTVYAGLGHGENERLPRSFENAPPQIPHEIGESMTITTDENLCIECHSPEMAEEVEAPPVPASHLYDFRENASRAELSPSNYNCNQCHVPQATAQPPLTNSFVPVFRSNEAKHKSNLLDVVNEGVK